MTVPLLIIETLERNLPHVEDVAGDFIDADLTYEGMEYTVRFYKVRDSSGSFWLCNPTRVQIKAKNKSNERPVLKCA